MAGECADGRTFELNGTRGYAEGYPLAKKITNKQKTWDFGRKYKADVTEGEIIQFLEIEKADKEERSSYDLSYHEKDKELLRQRYQNNDEFAVAIPPYPEETLAAVEHFSKYLSVGKRYDGSPALIFSIPKGVPWDIKLTGEKQCVIIDGYTIDDPKAVSLFYNLCDAILMSHTGRKLPQLKRKPCQKSTEYFGGNLAVTVVGNFAPDYTAFLEKEIQDSHGRKCVVLCVQSKDGRAPYGPHTTIYVVMGIWEAREVFRRQIIDLPEQPDQRNMPFGPPQEWWSKDDEVKRYL